ncbi:G-protein coupled receptor Mth2-like [Littorina saxatilis]|uniref:G-protein coupled receptor Mth2-like n=1 Tax=Littorina saxatilis TaxID=31220 RepID=UPI0038B42722
MGTSDERLLLSVAQGECLELQCAAGKTLEEGRCKTVVKRVTGLGYRLHIVLRPLRLQYRQDNRTATATTTGHWGNQPSQRQLMNCHYSKTLGQTMKKSLDRISVDLSMNITTAGTTHEACFAENYRDELERLMKHENTTSRDKGHLTIFDLDVEDFASNEARFLRAEVEAYILAKRSYGARDTEEDGIAFYVFDKMWKVKLGKWSLWLKVFDTSSKLLYGGKEQTDLAVFGTSDVDITRVPYTDNTRPLIRLEHLFLPLTNVLLCPHLYFERDEFTLVTCDDGEAQVKFPHFLDSDQKPLSFLAKLYPNGAWLTEDGQLRMCEDTFLHVFPQNVTVVKPMTTQRRPLSMVRLILNAVCGSISVVCLVVTFATYALFQVLRNLPGLNNMGLSLSLATAQLSLLLPWDSTGVVWVCRAVGVFTHWAWLTALSWMGVCCVHMVRVFTSKTRRSLTDREVRKVFLRYVLITCLFSTVIVLITVVVSSAVSGGASMGYGGPICFLDTELHRLVLLAFLLPLGLVVLTNLTCFVITVVSIVRVRRLQARAPRERRDVLVFAKLVTVTGGAWMLGFLAEFTDQEWMRVMADLCTVAQGLLLFLAYTCNKRVLRLYRARFRGVCKATPPDIARTQAPAIARTTAKTVTSSEAAG